jgi:hypothetical protein
MTEQLDDVDRNGPWFLVSKAVPEVPTLLAM